MKQSVCFAIVATTLLLCSGTANAEIVNQTYSVTLSPQGSTDCYDFQNGPGGVFVSDLDRAEILYQVM